MANDPRTFSASWVRPLTRQVLPTSWGRLVGTTSGGRTAVVTPFFVAPGGGTRLSVRTSAPHLDKECAHCSGADCDLVDESGELITRTTIQWAFFEPYRAWLGEAREAALEVVGFASALSLCA